MVTRFHHQFTVCVVIPITIRQVSCLLATFPDSHQRLSCLWSQWCTNSSIMQKRLPAEKQYMWHQCCMKLGCLPVCAVLCMTYSLSCWGYIAANTKSHQQNADTLRPVTWRLSSPGKMLMNQIDQYFHVEFNVLEQYTSTVRLHCGYC